MSRARAINSRHFHSLPQKVRHGFSYLKNGCANHAVQSGNHDGLLSCKQDGIHAVQQAGQSAGMQAGWLAGRLAAQKACLQSCFLCDIQSFVIVVIANSKGGVGKSTIAVHLAGWLAMQGHRVTLADCDTQASSSEWIREANPAVRTVRMGSPDEILNQLPLLNTETDFVIADGPGSNTETSRALLLRADFAIVPCKASMLEVRALAQATEVLRQAQDIRGGFPNAMIVLSMVGKNYRLTADMKDAAVALKLPLAKTALILRQIYADSPGQGTFVWAMKHRNQEAINELDWLFRELLPDAVTRTLETSSLGVGDQV
jgi:chromosome partitioning protein